jgi:hypothetical protein
MALYMGHAEFARSRETNGKEKQVNFDRAEAAH